MSTSKRARNRQRESAPITKTLQQPASPEEIRARAYQIFLERGQADGRDLDDWLLAEHELKHERSPECSNQSP
jgi:hypothetical protein